MSHIKNKIHMDVPEALSGMGYVWRVFPECHTQENGVSIPRFDFFDFLDSWK